MTDVKSVDSTISASIERTKKIKGVLFDMDGTLLDTEPCYEIAMTQAIQSLNLLGKVYTWDTQKLIVGKPEVVGATIIIEHLIGKSTAESINLTPEKLLEIRDQYLLEMFLKVRPKKGAVEILQAAKLAGIPVAIATSSNRKYLDIKSKNSPDAFALVDVIICGDDPEVIGKGKPRPDIYLAAAKAIGVAIHECAVFEDAEAGLKAGKAAGAAIVFVSPDHRLPRELFKDADVIVDEWTDLSIPQYL